MRGRPEELMRVLWCLLLAACAGEADYGGGGYLGDAGASTDGGFVGCLSSNECPAGYVCNEFGRCERPPSTDDAGVMPPPEVEYEFGAPISSQRYVYVA